jgi:hypothetical protein
MASNTYPSPSFSSLRTACEEVRQEARHACENAAQALQRAQRALDRSFSFRLRDQNGVKVPSKAE